MDYQVIKRRGLSYLLFHTTEILSDGFSMYTSRSVDNQTDLVKELFKNGQVSEVWVDKYELVVFKDDLIDWDDFTSMVVQVVSKN